MSTSTLLSKKLSKFAKHQHDKWEKLPVRTKTKVLLILIGIGLANLLYSLFGLYTIISMSVFLAGIGLLIKLRVDAVLERGLLSFASKKLQKVLLERSIFDFLCDLWFIPKIGLYLKAILRPFIVKINPEDAIHQFDELPESAQRAFLQKGIVNILPKKLRNVVLPKANRLINSTCEEENDSEPQQERNLEASSQRITPSSSSQALNSETHHRKGEKGRESEITTSKEKASFLSTDEEPKNLLHDKITEVKSWLSLTNATTNADAERGLSLSRARPKRKGSEKKIPKKLEKSYIFDPVDSNGGHSEIITSSAASTEKPLSQQDAYKWDKLDFFLKVYQEKMKQNQKKQRKAAPLKGPLQMIEKLRALAQLSKKGFLNHIDEKRLLRVFCLSSIGLLLQFVLSKKARNWLYNTLHILTYVVGFVVSSGTFALYMIKMKKKREEQQRRLGNAENTEEEVSPLAQ